MLQQIALALLSLAACLPSAAAAYHSPIDIIRRGAAHSAQFDRRDTETVKKHDDPFKKFAYYNAATARTFLYLLPPLNPAVNNNGVL